MREWSSKKVDGQVCGWVMGERVGTCDGGLT